MKKQLLKSALIIVAGVGLFAWDAMANNYSCPGDAQCTYQDTNTYGEFLSYTSKTLNFDITPAGFKETDISTASVTFNITDNDGHWYEEEWIQAGTGWSEVDDGITSPFSLTLNQIHDLENDGKLAFSMYVKGDLYLNSATLTAKADCAPVPEPATMLLFGTGLAGIAGIARRKRS